ncbi:MAG: 50S ribosomal protein L11 methyltransferase [Chitinophagales bacterium]|nr:50S ribosomal protein L11 methyltransferase [Chitinophagales bacterium]MCZ2394358.1 50S ribosomal protein L11 methyltransferase [Chitinophagales bacterium]
MTLKTWIYQIETPETLETEEFAGLFSWMEIEGIEEQENSIKIYVSEEYIADFEPYLLETLSSYSLPFTKEILEQKNWNEDWEKNFKPVQIGQLAGIRASFHPAFENVKYDIIINPKMSFGTGHHATTRQVIEVMEKVDIQGKKVLDCGSGTGILSIIAAKMDAAEVVAVDNDPWCYENHIENNELNQVQTEVILGGIEDIQREDFDIILANIQRNYLLEFLSELSKRLKSGGNIIISGFFPSDENDILEEAAQHQLIASYSVNSDNWSCILLHKKS